MTNLYGDLTENGVEVFEEGDLVILVDNNERIERPNTLENRKELLYLAEEVERQWKKEQIFDILGQ
jgi:hypothetical protein